MTLIKGSPSFADIKDKIPDWKNKFQSLDFLETLIRMITEQFFDGAHKDSASEILSLIYNSIGKVNLHASLNLAKSPIERIFLAQIVVSFYYRHPLLLMVGPNDNFYKDFQKALNNDERVNTISKATGKKPGDVAKEVLNEEEYEDHLWYTLIYRDLQCIQSIQMYPQYRFHGIEKIEKKFAPLKRYCADVFFFKFQDPRSFSLIVECDGYKWHKQKKAFTHDRQRDRAFRTAGIDVLRYSGSEIVNDPISCALNLFKYFETNWDLPTFISEGDV
jgi:very-short-patch-repair endonuclease